MPAGEETIASQFLRPRQTLGLEMAHLLVQNVAACAEAVKYPCVHSLAQVKTTAEEES
jgi:hypothetical protein